MNEPYDAEAILGQPRKRHTPRVGSLCLTPLGRRQPAGAEPRRLGFGKTDALHTAIYDAVGVAPAGITHPDRRLVRLVIVDENRLLTMWIGKVAEVLAWFVAVNRR